MPKHLTEKSFNSRMLRYDLSYYIYLRILSEISNLCASNA